MTRCVTTNECDLSVELKKSYIEARREDIVIIESPIGFPGRAIRNKFLDDVGERMRKSCRCPYHCLLTGDCQRSPHYIATALMNAKKGRLKSGFTSAGGTPSGTRKSSPSKPPRGRRLLSDGRRLRGRWSSGRRPRISLTERRLKTATLRPGHHGGPATR